MVQSSKIIPYVYYYNYTGTFFGEFEIIIILQVLNFAIFSRAEMTNHYVEKTIYKLVKLLFACTNFCVCVPIHKHFKR